MPAMISSFLKPDNNQTECDRHNDSNAHQSAVSTDDSLSIGGRMDDSNITVHELKRLEFINL